MKKQRDVLLVGILLLVLFITVSVFTFHRSQDRLERGYLASEGNAAENFAVLTAANVKLTDAQVAHLKACTYGELMNSEENEALREMMNQPGLVDQVSYAYVMLQLSEDEVRYSVTEELAQRFDAPVGTKLDILWLLDVVAGQTAAEQAGESDELTRYSYYIEQDEKIFTQSPMYIFNSSSEWGDHICGYAPLYSVEGHYIGVIGVEIHVSDYVAYCGEAVRALGILMCVSLLMLSLLFVYIYLRYRKAQFDKVYVDALVQVYNRSYFNNRLCKYLNAHRTGSRFAMMIADVDWFKKVNDTFGHEVGDEVLIEVAQILVEVFGKTQVVRLGGEEFVVALWFDDEKKLTEQLQTLFDKIEQHRFSAREITLSISLGCSHARPEEINGWLISGMLRAADCKLYEAKEGGRKRYLIEEYDEKKVYAKGGEKPEQAHEEDTPDEH